VRHKRYVGLLRADGVRIIVWMLQSYAASYVTGNDSRRGIDNQRRMASMSGSNLSIRTENAQERVKDVAMNAAWNAGKIWWDLFTSFQRTSLMAFSPTAKWDAGESTYASNVDRVAQIAGTQVIEVGEERLNVGTLTVPGETTRVRRRVISQPVEQNITLRDETVIVERRPGGNSNPKPSVLTETVIEMSDSRQVPRVWKSLHVAEEVVLRKQVTERVEHVRETVRRDVVDVEHRPETMVVPAAKVETSKLESPVSEPKFEARIPEARIESRAGVATPSPELEVARRLQAQAAEKRLHDEAMEKKPAVEDKKPGPEPVMPPGSKRN
jgi:stress response protein YsnF